MPRLLRVLHELVLAFVEALRPEGLDRAAGERLRLVGNHEAEVDADHAAEAAAGFAGAERRVEREARGRGIRIVDVAVGAVEIGRETPRLGALVADEHVHLAHTDPQRRFDRLDDARLLRARHLHAVLHDIEARALALVDARVALRLEELGDFLLAEVLRHVHRERDHEARIAGRCGALAHLAEDRLRRVAPHGTRAAAAVQVRRAREEQLQVIVDLRHRPDGRARRAHRVRLVDRDGRRDALDRVHLRLVHPVEELARVGRERLHVAALSLGVERVEDERGLARARGAGDHDELARGNVDVEVLEVVLARAADDDGVAASVVLQGFGVGGSAGAEVVHGGSHSRGPGPRHCIKGIIWG